MQIETYYGSSVLLLSAFNTADDIIVSLLHTDFSISNLGTFQSENEDNFLLEDGNELLLDIPNGYVDGLSIFLVNADPRGNKSYDSSFTGGGLKVTSGNTQNPGIGVVRDNTVTAVSAISGITLVAAYDRSGKFSRINTIDQFKTGTSGDNPDHIAVRVADRGSTISNLPSAFPYKGSQAASDITTRVEDTFAPLALGFKRHLQEVVVYHRTNDALVPLKTIPTDIPFNVLPEYVRIGFGYSGRRPMELKNITVNGNKLA